MACSRLAAAKLVLLVVATAAACSFSQPSAATAATHALEQLRPDDTGVSCLPHERDALLTFKQGITSDDDGFLASWRRGQEEEEDCCRWRGVTCSNRTGHVVKLDLGDSGLQGQISPLISLEQLEYLDLSWNEFSGSFPAFVGCFKNLRYLNLSHTSFTGEVPHQLGNLSNLRELDLAGSFMLYSHMHATNLSWLAHMHYLEYLDMSYINLSMVVDWPSVINTIPSMESLQLSGCSLPGTSQSMTQLNLTRLVELDVSNNYFGNPLGTSNALEFFGSMENIRYLDLSGTSILSGRVPPHLGNLSNLRHLGLGSLHNTMYATDISCTITDWPLVVNMIPSLKVLYLIECSLQSANQSLAHLNLTKLEELDLSLNYFGHPIASCWFWKVKGIKYLSLIGTYLDGPFPDALFLALNRLNGQIPLLPKNLRTLDIAMNNFSGHLPVEFGAPHLEVIVLSSNHITGHVPRSIFKLQKLSFLDLTNNSFYRELPIMPNLLSCLLLSNNRFSGKFPSWLKSFSKLVFLDLSWNNLDGTLPIWIGDLAGLTILQLDHNMFYGDIPVTITNLIQLQLLNLASNNLSGPTPQSLSNIIGMTTKAPKREWIEFSERLTDVLSVVMKHQELKYHSDGISDMVVIDLSLNHLTGEIPNEITSLDGLVSLNLSWNHLSGKIPKNIGAMKSLESLELSRNNISGEMPAGLSDLTF
ncbi:receptor-like protein EIX1 [Oryza glaberrima]|uniref:receptor-like protein EIX1 n=1 Tax=Oryza glaberrima TaxID=4538 RepID=UPI00224C4671|nr:receptor-like protein EIX1 [Oryza glaberrima]